MVTLEGGVEIGVGDGTLRRFGPGDVALTEDLAGQGRFSRAIGHRIAAIIPLES